MTNKKYYVFYRRIATGNPDNLAVQATADHVYRQNFFPSDIKVIEEYGSGFSKATPGFNEVKSLIKKSLVHTLYVSDLSRLFRDSYAVAAFHELLEEHGVSLIFTAHTSGNKEEQSL